MGELVRGTDDRDPRQLIVTIPHYFLYIILSSILLKYTKGLWGRIGRRSFIRGTSFGSNFAICRK